MLSSKSNCGMNTREVSDSPKFTRDEPHTSQLLWLKFMEIGHKQDCYIVWPNLPSAPMTPQISLLHFPDVSLVSPGHLLLPCPEWVFTQYTSVLVMQPPFQSLGWGSTPVIFVAIFRSPWVALYSCAFVLGKLSRHRSLWEMWIESRKQVVRDDSKNWTRYSECERMALKAYALKWEGPKGATCGSSFGLLG